MTQTVSKKTNIQTDKKDPYKLKDLLDTAEKIEQDISDTKNQAEGLLRESDK